MDSRFWKALDILDKLQMLWGWAMAAKTQVAAVIAAVGAGGWFGGLAIGVTAGILVYVLLVMLERARKPFLRVSKGNLEPKEFVFPYIHTIDAQNLIRDREGFILATVCFPSALPKVDILLTGELIINGARTERLPGERVSLSKPAVYTISQWRAQVPLTLQRTIRNAVEGGRPLSVSAEIWSYADPSFHWNLEERTIHPLVGQTP